MELAKNLSGKAFRFGIFCRQIASRTARNFPCFTTEYCSIGGNVTQRGADPAERAMAGLGWMAVFEGCVTGQALGKVGRLLSDVKKVLLYYDTRFPTPVGRGRSAAAFLWSFVR